MQSGTAGARASRLAYLFSKVEPSLHVLTCRRRNVGALAALVDHRTLATWHVVEGRGLGNLDRHQGVDCIVFSQILINLHT